MQDPQEPTNNNWRPAIFKLFHHRRRYDSLNENYKKELDNLFGSAIKYTFKKRKPEGVLPADPQERYKHIFADLKNFLTGLYFDERNNREKFKNLNQEELYKRFRNKAFNYLAEKYWKKKKRDLDQPVCWAEQKSDAAEKVNEKGEPQPVPDEDVSSADAFEEIGGECPEMISIKKHARRETAEIIKKELPKYGMTQKDIVKKNISVSEPLVERAKEIMKEQMIISAGIQCAQKSEKDAEIYLENELNNKKNKKT